MFNSITKNVQGNCSLGLACGWVSDHWELFPKNIVLNLDLNGANFIDPAIVGLAILVNKHYPGMFCFSNTNEGSQKIIDKVYGKINPGTIFPAMPIGNYLNGELLSRFNFWSRLVLTRFYNASKRSEASQVGLSAVELINNVIDHSQADLGGIIVGASFKQRKHFEITVLDFGKTIPGTLEELFPGRPDEEIITMAMEFGVSRRKGSEHNFGRGLDIIKQYALQDRECSLQIISRKGFVSITNAELPHVRSSRYTFPGTIVKCCFSERFVANNLEECSTLEELEF
jgi:anti-sigma regulatory factor (Ser/Thr protein kinase)